MLSAISHRSLLAAALIVGLAGCFEQPDVDIHKPGQYQGPSDPLLQLSGTEAQNEALAKRLRMVQTDR